MVASTIPRYDIALLVVALAVGYIAFRSADAFRHDHGVSPWGWPPMVWFAIGFISLLLCCVLFYTARSSTLKRLRQASPLPDAEAEPHIETIKTVEAAGWYPDPKGSTNHRYWNGSQWTNWLQPPAAGI